MKGECNDMWLLWRHTYPWKLSYYQAEITNRGNFHVQIQLDLKVNFNLIKVSMFLLSIAQTLHARARTLLFLRHLAKLEYKGYCELTSGRKKEPGIH